MATVSIIIPTWNTSVLTEANVNLLLNTKTKHHLEIIVVDNNSTDNTSDIFKKKPVVFLKLSKNLGYGKAGNVGVKNATGDYFLFLNSDMEIVTGLDLLIDYAQKTPHSGIVGPKFLNTDGSVQGSAFPPQSIVNAIKEFWFGKKVFSKFAPSSDSPTPVWAISGGAMLISRKLFEAVGGWDERYHMYYEDLELCRSVRALGYKIVYFPSCRFTHRHGASGTKLSDPDNQWRRLIKSSQIYHGLVYHKLLNFIIWSGQKFSPFKT